MNELGEAFYMPIEIYIQIALLIIFILLSSFFSSAETSLSSMNAIKVRQLKEKGLKDADIVRRLLGKSNRVLHTILIGNNIVNIGATAIATKLTVDYLGGSTVLVTLIMTLTILIFGEITPKTYAAQQPDKVAIFVARPLEMLSVVLSPVIRILSYITKIFIRIMGGNIRENIPFVTEEEIKTLVNVGQEEGLLHQRETEMIKSIFEFDDITAKEVMIPRIDITGLEVTSSLQEAMETIVEAGYSRIPVYYESIDNIIGIIYAKDLLNYSIEKDKTKNIRTLMRKAIYVPESKKINDLLKELQKNKVHMAIILDEYGGTAGLVTIEDLLEEIVGDIFDEFDEEEDEIQILNERELIVTSRVSIEEINEILNTNFPEDDFETISGFAFNMLGRIPKEGDIIDFEDVLIKVLKVSQRRIDKIKIQVKEK